MSHGCIRMLPQEMVQLFPQIEVGTPVKIIYRPIKLAVTPPRAASFWKRTPISMI